MFSVIVSTFTAMVVSAIIFALQSELRHVFVDIIHYISFRSSCTLDIPESNNHKMFKVPSKSYAAFCWYITTKQPCYVKEMILLHFSKQEEDKYNKVFEYFDFAIPQYQKKHSLNYRGETIVYKFYKYKGAGDRDDELGVMLWCDSKLGCKFLIQAISEMRKEQYEWHKSQIWQQTIYNTFNRHNNEWKGQKFYNNKSIKSVILHGSLNETILNDAKDFLNSETWYCKLGLPFKRGYLFHGAPGTGKSRGS